MDQFCLSPIGLCATLCIFCVQRYYTFKDSRTTFDFRPFISLYATLQTTHGSNRIDEMHGMMSNTASVHLCRKFATLFVSLSLSYRFYVRCTLFLCSFFFLVEKKKKTQVVRKEEESVCPGVCYSMHSSDGSCSLLSPLSTFSSLASTTTCAVSSVLLLRLNYYHHPALQVDLNDPTDEKRQRVFTS